MVTVKTVKVLYIQTLRQFIGWVYPCIDGRLVLCTVSEGISYYIIAKHNGMAPIEHLHRRWHSSLKH